MRRFRQVSIKGTLLLASVGLVVACTTGGGGSTTTTQPGATTSTGSGPTTTSAAPEQPAFADNEIVVLVLGSSPGGGFDTQARLLQPYLQDELRAASGAEVRLLVENQPGANHRVATEFVNRSTPDGKTFIFTTPSHLLSNQLFEGANYDIREMTMIGSHGRANRAFAIRKDVELTERTFLGLVERSREVPVLLSYPGTGIDLTILQGLLEDGGMPMAVDPVAVGSTSDQVAALLRGDIEVAWTATSGLKPFIDDNPDDIEFLVNLGCEREDIESDLETIVEAGAANSEDICLVVGADELVFVGPPGISASTLAIITTSLENAINNPEYQDRIAAAGFPNRWNGPDETSATIETMYEIYTRYGTN